MAKVLDSYEIQRAKMCIANIKDKLKAVETELLTRETPYKSYLYEKIESMKWDTNVLLNMCKGDKDDE